MEVWKDIKGFEKFYQVSNLGRVRSLDRVVEMSDGRRRKERGQILKPRVKTNRGGYLSVVLRKAGTRKDFTVHQLVALAFVPNPDPETLTQINHKDEDKTNNKPSNLEWCTQEYNNSYGTRLARAAKSRTNKGGRPVIGTNISTGKETYYVTMSEAQRAGFDKRNIHKVCNGINKTHKRHTWRYAEENKEEETS